MKRTLWLVPLLALTTFAGYYRHWHETPAVVTSSGPIADFYENRNGRVEAEISAARGKLVLLTCGLPVVWGGEFAKILQRDYGIEQRTVAGCVVTEPLLKFVHDYNAVMEREILARHGNDLFERVQAQAQAAFAEHNPPNPKAVGLD